VDGRGCWRFDAGGDTALIVLPEGFEVGRSGTTVVAANGDLIDPTTPVSGSGALLGVDDLPGGTDGRWGNYLAYCDPDATAVLVSGALTSATFDPHALDDAELATLVQAAEFDTDWGCGYGFATSTADQRVGLYLTPTTPEPPAAGLVTLPDDRFEANVVVGKNLFVNHCDDVVEWSEPERQVGVSWPVTSGHFDYPLADPDRRCGLAGSVRVILQGAVVTTASGDVPLASLTIENDAFGCFAG